MQKHGAVLKTGGVQKYGAVLKTGGVQKHGAGVVLSIAARVSPSTFRLLPVRLQTHDTSAWKTMPWDLLEISEFKLQEWFVLFLMPLPVVCTLSTHSQSNWNIETECGFSSQRPNGVYRVLPSLFPDSLPSNTNISPSQVANQNLTEF